MLGKELVTVVICSILVILSSIIAVQWEWLAIEKLEKRNLQSQLEYLQTQAEAESERFEYAQQQADEQLKQMQQQVDEVFKAPVSKKCNEAIEWAIEEAKSFQA